MVIRKGRPDEGKEAAELINEAAHGFVQDCMGPTGLKIQEKLFSSDRGFMNYQHSFFAEVDGMTAGMAMVYSGEEKKSGGAATTLLFLRHINFSLLAHLPVLLRSDTFPAFDPAENELYLHGIAVYDTYRGKGIGAALLSHIDEYAKEKNLARIMLAAETNNTKAIELYKRCGYYIDGESMSFQTKKKTYHFYKICKDVT